MAASITIRDVPADPIAKTPAHSLFVTGGGFGVTRLSFPVMDFLKKEHPNIYEKANVIFIGEGDCDWSDLTEAEFKIVLKPTILLFEAFMKEFIETEDKNSNLGMLQLWTQYMHYMTSDPRSGFAVRPLNYNLF